MASSQELFGKEPEQEKYVNTQWEQEQREKNKVNCDKCNILTDEYFKTNGIPSIIYCKDCYNNDSSFTRSRLSTYYDSNYSR